MNIVFLCFNFCLTTQQIVNFFSSIKYNYNNIKMQKLFIIKQTFKLMYYIIQI